MPSPETALLLQALWRNVQNPGTPLLGLRDRLNDAVIRMPTASGVLVATERIGELHAEWLNPPEPLADGSGVVLYFHGGGYAIGSLNSARPLASNLARVMRWPVLALDYRLSPEHPFPAAIEDGVQAYRWLLELGYAPSKILIAGDSAGGGLCIAVLLALRDHGHVNPAGGVCFSPWLDLTLNSSTLVCNAEQDPVVQRWILAEMAAWYLNGHDPREPLASPVFANLRGLPPLLVQVSSSECLLDDARGFCSAALSAGVDVTLQTWPGVPHVWHAFAPRLPEAEEAFIAASDWVSRLLDSRTRGSENPS